MLTVRLSFMMFLQFFIWGGWFVTLGTFLGNTLGASGREVAMAFSTQSWGAIIAPLIIGLIADRYFNAERILGVLHLAGAVLMFQLYNASNFAEFYPYVLAYMIFYMPTLALVNSVSFRQMTDTTKQFPYIRVFGTIGWIAAVNLISLLGWDSEASIAGGMLKNTFLMVSMASAFLGVYSFSLPKTPPQVNRNGKPSLPGVLGLEALKLLKNKNFLLFFITSVLICIPLAFYYQNLSPFLTESKVANSSSWTSVGQVTEVLFMLLLPIFFKRFGFKKTMLLGMLAWAIRYVLFAYGNGGALFFMVVTGILLHGICYDFFFVSGQVYADSKAGTKYRSAVQGLITLATYGLGMLIGYGVAGHISDTYVVGDGHQWKNIWLYPASFAALVMVLFSLSFKEEKQRKGATLKHETV